MNVSYLLSILNLYLNKEKQDKLIISFDNLENLVKVDFCYLTSQINKTFVKLDKKLFFNNLDTIVNNIQEKFKIEKENLDYKNNKFIYTLDSLKQSISFQGFTKEELELIRKSFNNLETEFSFKIDSYDEMYKNTNNNSKLVYKMGFTSYLTLFLSSIFLLDILVISLFIFKNFLS